MSNIAGTACSLTEKTFGPSVVSGCLDGFDFTLLFEDSILTILPLGIAVLWSCSRLVLLWARPRIVYSGFLLYLKLGAYTSYAGLQIALLPVWTDSQAVRTSFTAPSIGLAIATFVLLACVTWLEHTRSLRPSTFLVVYLTISTLLDLARARTAFLLGSGNAVSGLILASLLVKVSALCLELVEKRHIALPASADPSPEAFASVWNKAFFAWLNPLLCRGFRKTLALDDLLPLDADLAAASRPVELSARWKQADKSCDDALLLIFIFHYKWSILIGVVPRLCSTGFSFAQPFLVQRVLQYLDNPEENADNVGYGLVGAYAIVYIGISITSALYEYYTNRLMAKFRGSLISLICQKTLRVSASSTSNAEAITLMSADIDRIEMGGHLLHETYASVIELALSLWLLYRLLDVAVAASTVWLIIALVIGIPLATIAGNAQVPWLEAIEERLAVTAKTVSQLMPIKMAGLAQPVTLQISSLRSAEIRASLRYRLMTAFMTSASFLSSSFTPVVGLGAFALLARSHGTGTLTADVAFAALTLFDLQQQPVSFLLEAVEDFMIAINCFRRIQQFLVSEEQADYRALPYTGRSISETSQGSQGSQATHTGNTSTEIADPEKRLVAYDPVHAFIAINASGGYTDSPRPVLKDLNFEIPLSKTTVITGPVGSGKSSLLKLILGELPSQSGSVSARFTEAAYCPQTPWIMSGTIRSNIIGMSEWNQPWYERVVNSCALCHDFKELPMGDHSATGTGGSRLSGGQKTRISLARALYSRKSIVVLDSVLSGLDTTTENIVMEAVFSPQGLLRELGVTTILATTSGICFLSPCIISFIPFSSLLPNFVSTVYPADQLAHHASIADHVVALSSKGEVHHTGAVNDLTADQGVFVPYSKDESPPLRDSSQTEANSDVLDGADFIEDSGIGRSTSDTKVYLFYLRTVGVRLMLVYLIACATYIVSYVFPNIWVQIWTNSNAQNPNNRVGYWIGVYAALAFVTIVSSVLSEMLFMLVIVPKTSRRFHEHLLTTTMRATASFLTSTDAGTTTNRFSQDLELIDNDLPQSFDLFVIEAMNTISSVVLIFVGSGYAAATVPVCIGILYLIQKFYLRTSRQMRLLDIEAKAPLFSNFLETLNGVGSIRAYNWTEYFLNRHIAALNDSQKPYYLMICIQRWLTLVLDLFVAGLAILLVGIAVNIRGGATNYLGVALLNIVSLSTTLQGLVTQWTSLETAIGAVNRIKAYVAETAPEDRDDEPKPVSDTWPERGRVSLDRVFASFGASDELVLKDITLDVRPGEKIAICGRTGSGKSSLVSAILNLLSLKSGCISIDGVSISEVSRELLRTRVNTLPQEGVILEGTVRENLDLSDDIGDERLIQVLSDLQLWKIFENGHGLDETLNEDMLSHGQRQLFCLARAILKSGRILIMDESTSSVDLELEELIERTIAYEFQEATVIAVVHKLRVALNFDRIVVIDNGRIVECASPQELLDIPSSAFNMLYQGVAPLEASKPS